MVKIILIRVTQIYLMQAKQTIAETINSFLFVIIFHLWCIWNSYWWN